jgi:phospholipase/carboxylesterase
MLLPAVEIAPTAPHTATVIWLHGLGASGHDFEPIVPMLRMPWARFVFPHAPARAVTINGGYVMPSWYDIRHFDWDDAGREDEGQVRESAALIDALVAHEANAVPSTRIVLAGFSQGGALALYVANRSPLPLAGVLILSAYLLPGAEVAAANAATPTLFLHGRHDDVVPMIAGQRAFQATSRLRDRWRGETIPAATRSSRTSSATSPASSTNGLQTGLRHDASPATPASPRFARPGLAARPAGLREERAAAHRAE